ncbi:amidohydrolase family protein [Conexibacter sp. CPCC 206217]|uniref:amidohydrolase family protein n=1 Tax=Conexibacter sp. CPCC 206217 TaxID=3064574 RepID=UPI00271CC744|nr:amidohydrolase family protein [Conexibacter sp. CPCC 206217]MDO8210141.1 amidohydrolase family protein [Conexibacter sp. CPCC 206217]
MSPGAEEELLARLAASSGDPRRRLLLRGGTVLSMDPAIGDREVADVLIEGRRIAAIEADLEAAAAGAIVVDVAGRILIPGLQDTHRHCWQSQFRHAWPDGSIHDYVATIHEGLGPHYRPEDMYAATLMSALGALDAGITCVMDFCHNSRSAAHTDAAIAAWRESGIRAVHASCGAVAGDWDRQWPQDLRRLREQMRSDEDLVTLRMGIVTPVYPGVADEIEITPQRLALARELGLATSVDGVVGPLAAQRVVELGEAGLLGPDLTFIHCLDMPEEAWRHLAHAGSHVSMAPTSDTNLSQESAIPSIQQALDAGIRPSIGADVECCLSTDLFAHMHAVLTIQRMLAQNRRHGGEVDPPAPLTAREVLEFATVRGAEANAVSDRSGTLTPGKDADIAVIDGQHLRTLPLNNAIGTVVLGTDPSTVESVFVAGDVRKWSGRLVGHDVARLRRIVRASRDHVLESSGMRLDVLA